MSRRRLYETLLSLFFIAGVMLAACGTAAPAATKAPSAPAAPSTADEEYIYVSMMGNLEFFNAHKYGWKWAGEALGVKATYVGPAEYDVNCAGGGVRPGDRQEPGRVSASSACDPSLKPEIDKATDGRDPGRHHPG